MNTKMKNELIKRQYFCWMTDANGCCENTATIAKNALLSFEEFTEDADYGTVNKNTLIEFKNWFLRRTVRGKPITLATNNTYLRHLRKFFTWLCLQKGYRGKITPETISYLNLNNNQKQEALQHTPTRYPNLQYVMSLVNTIKVKSEIDLMERALICFALISGARIQSMATLRFGCFDENTLIVDLNPSKGVKTKKSKHIVTKLLIFDDKLLEYFLGWYHHLKKKGYKSDDPLFPRHKRQKDNNNLCFGEPVEVEPFFWKGLNRIRAIFEQRSQNAGLPYFHPHTFRHLHLALALQACSNEEEKAAVCQNIGHSRLSMADYYVKKEPEKLSETLNSLDVSGKSKKPHNEKLNKIRKILDEP